MPAAPVINSRRKGSASLWQMSQQRLVYSTPRWDNYQWESTLAYYPQASQAVSEGLEKIYSFPTFAREVFSRFYSGNS